MGNETSKTGDSEADRIRKELKQHKIQMRLLWQQNERLKELQLQQQHQQRAQSVPAQHTVSLSTATQAKPLTPSSSSQTILLNNHMHTRTLTPLYPNLSSQTSPSSSSLVTPSAPPAAQLSTKRPRNDEGFVMINNPSTTRSDNAQNNQRCSPSPVSPGQDPDASFNCPTCKQRFGEDIFQCGHGHSACGPCKHRRALCGVCKQTITNMRNYALQALIAERTVPCVNARQGCQSTLRPDQVSAHLLECAHNEIDCPVAIFGRCSWKGNPSGLSQHFNERHPEHRQGDVNREMILPNILYDDRFLHLVDLGPHHFVVHIRVTELGKIYMAVQMLGSELEASKWVYELHIYNKREPRRKFQYSDSCRSIHEPAQTIMDNCNCAVLPLAYATTMVNSGFVTYKFFIKKEFDSYKDGGFKPPNRRRFKPKANCNP